MYDLDHVYDYDASAIRERRRKWGVFLTGLFIASAGAAGLAGFSFARDRAVLSSYETYLSQAKNTGDPLAAADYYSRAVNMQPQREEAYASLLEDICADGRMSPDEKKLLEEILNKSSETRTGTRSNLEILKHNAPKSYASFLFRLGQDYYAFYENGIREANACFHTVMEDEHLEEKKRTVAVSMSAITDYYVALANSRKSWSQQEEAGCDYAEFWKTLTALTADPSAADRKAGGRPYALAVYRELATQIALNLTAFVNAGISLPELSNALDTAQTYLDTPAASDSEANRELVKQAADALASAGNAVSIVQSRLAGSKEDKIGA
jgi:hypothetical protein